MNLKMMTPQQRIDSRTSPPRTRFTTSDEFFTTSTIEMAVAALPTASRRKVVIGIWALLHEGTFSSPSP